MSKQPMSTADIVAAIDAITGADPEIAHSALDDLLLECVPNDVAAAAIRLMGRCRWWACA